MHIDSNAMVQHKAWCTGNRRVPWEVDIPLTGDYVYVTATCDPCGGSINRKPVKMDAAAKAEQARLRAAAEQKSSSSKGDSGKGGKKKKGWF